MGLKRPRIVHPLVFAASYVLSSWIRNLELLDATAVVRPLAFALGSTAAFWLAATMALRDVCRGGFVTSAFLLVAFQYGATLDVLGRWVGPAVGGSSDPVLQGGLAIGAIALCAAGVLAVGRRATALAVITRFLNAASLAWMLSTAWLLFSRWPASIPVELPPLVATEQPRPSMTSPPNVFYIVLDAYGRSDVLQALYDYDDGAFLESLARKGFRVARRSRANYPQTSLSLASAMNMTYLDEVAAAVGPTATTRRPLVRLVDDSRLVGFLRTAGYRFVWFSSGAAIAELRTPDVILTAPWSLSEFENLLLSMSALPYWWRIAQQLPGGGALPDQFDAHRARVRYVLETLPDQAVAPGPVFVLAHILCPHPPFVFDERGNRPTSIAMGPYAFFNDGVYSRQRADYVAGYRSQIAFISREVDAAIDAILARSPTPPIIIVQGDHGPGSMWDPIDAARTMHSERFPILNAYYFPRGDYADVSDTITPVNSFRVVLRRYFATPLELLEDRSYFATWNAPYRFIEVTDELR